MDLRDTTTGELQPQQSGVDSTYDNATGQLDFIGAACDALQQSHIEVVVVSCNLEGG